MNKLLLVCAGAIMMAACSKNDKARIMLSSAEITLNQGKTYVLTPNTEGIGAGEKLTWFSENSYVAKVDQNGRVTANYVGTTTITVSAAGKAASCRVIVEPLQNLYIEPVLEFGAGRAAIKSKEKRYITSEDNVHLVYEDWNAMVNFIDYQFENDRLKGVVVSLRSAAASFITKFLAERYQAYGTDGNYIYWGNGEIAIGVTVSGSQILVIYIPDTTDFGRSGRTDAFEEAVAAFTALGE